MPCRDDRELYDREIAKQKEAIKTAPPDLLCEACTLLEEHDLLSKTSKELRDWFVLHERHEVDRVKFEAAQKLSARERRLFGINIKALKDALPKSKK
jgi:hypothetical protein